MRVKPEPTNRSMTISPQFVTRSGPRPSRLVLPFSELKSGQKKLDVGSAFYLTSIYIVQRLSKRYDAHSIWILTTMPFVEYKGSRILFIHIPRTGGTTVESWLRSLGPVHFFSTEIPAFSKCTPQHYRTSNFRKPFEEAYFTYIFTIVRNPYDRIESAYRFLATNQGSNFFKYWPSFSVRLEKNLNLQKSNAFHLDNHLRPQWEFVGSQVYIFKHEDGLNLAVQQIAKLLDLPPPVDLPHELSTKELPVAVAWDLADRLILQEHYRRDFLEFGYSQN